MLLHRYHTDIKFDIKTGIECHSCVGLISSFRVSVRRTFHRKWHIIYGSIENGLYKSLQRKNSYDVGSFILIKLINLLLWLHSVLLVYIGLYAFSVTRRRNLPKVSVILTEISY
jgi:hypothetical protein